MAHRSISANPRILVGTMLSLTTTVSSCASATKSQTDLLRERLEMLAESHQQDNTFLIRWNPVPCDSPEWEVRIEGVWRRAYLEPAGDPVETLRRELSDPEGRPLPKTARVVGRLSSGVRMSGNRTPCLVLKVFGPCQEDCETSP